MAAPLRLALFDCDGTLVDSLAAAHGAMNAACLSLGVDPPSEAEHRSVFGVPVLAQMTRLFPVLEPARHQALADSFFHHHRSANQLEPLYAGAREAIRAIEAANWLLGIATAKSGRGLQQTLDRHGLHRHFLTLQTADTNPAKPNPAMALNAMRVLGVDAENTVMIGDSVYDMEMARHAGIIPLGVAWGYHDAHALMAAGARAVATDFAALPALLADLVPCAS